MPTRFPPSPEWQPSPTTTSTQLLTHQPQLCICQNDSSIKLIFPDWRPPNYMYSNTDPNSATLFDCVDSNITDYSPFLISRLSHVTVLYCDLFHFSCYPLIKRFIFWQVKIELIILIYLGLSYGRRVRRTVVICQRRDCFPAKKIMCFFQKSVFRENVIKHYESVLQPWPKLQIPQDPRNWQTNAHCDRSHYIGASELTARHDSQKARNVWTSCRCSYFATASRICEEVVIIF